jgi:nicotinamide riboside kinase
VQQLNHELQQAWYDIAMLLRNDTRWSDLEHLYGPAP